MAIIKKKEMRQMDAAALSQKTDELRRELRSELGTIASGGKAKNPGRIREIRRTIARIMTLQTQKGAS